MIVELMVLWVSGIVLRVESFTALDLAVRGVEGAEP